MYRFYNSMESFDGPYMHIVEIQNSNLREPFLINKKNIFSKILNTIAWKSSPKEPNVLDEQVNLRPALVIHGRSKAAARGGFSKQEEH